MNLIITLLSCIFLQGPDQVPEARKETPEAQPDQPETQGSRTDDDSPLAATANTPQCTFDSNGVDHEKNVHDYFICQEKHNYSAGRLLDSNGRRITTDFSEPLATIYFRAKACEQIKASMGDEAYEGMFPSLEKTDEVPFWFLSAYAQINHVFSNGSYEKLFSQDKSNWPTIRQRTQQMLHNEEYTLDLLWEHFGCLVYAQKFD